MRLMHQSNIRYVSVGCVIIIMLQTSQKLRLVTQFTLITRMLMRLSFFPSLALSLLLYPKRIILKCLRTLAFLLVVYLAMQAAAQNPAMFKRHVITSYSIRLAAYIIIFLEQNLVNFSVSARIICICQEVERNAYRISIGSLVVGTLLSLSLKKLQMSRPVIVLQILTSKQHKYLEYLLQLNR